MEREGNNIQVSIVVPLERDFIRDLLAVDANKV